MSEGLVTRLRRIYGQEEPGSEKISVPSPVRQFADRAIWALHRDRLPTWFRSGWEVYRCDLSPSIDVDGKTAYRIVLGFRNDAPWQPPKPLDGIRGPDAPSTWLALAVFPVGVGTSKERIPWESLKGGPASGFDEPYPNDYARAVDMGEGGGYHWYGWGTVGQLDAIRTELRLTGGDNRVELIRRAIAGAKSGEQSALAYRWLIDAGGQDAALDERVKKESLEAFTNAIGNDARRDNTQWALDAITRFGWPEAVPLLQTRIAQPGDLHNYCRLFKALRAAEGRPLPVDTEAMFSEAKRKHRDPSLSFEDIAAVKAALLACPDREAAMAFAAELSVPLTWMPGMGTYGGPTATIGREVLQQLPRDVTIPALQHLVSILPQVKDLSNNGYTSDRDAVESFLATLENAPQ